MARANAASRRPPLLPAAMVAAIKRWSRRFAGLGLMALAAALAAALISYHAEDPSLDRVTAAAPQNWLGYPGAAAADLLLQTLGVASTVFAVALAGWGWRVASGKGLPWFWTHLLALPLAVLAFALAAAQLPPAEAWPLEVGYGGLMGDLFAARIAEIALALGLPVADWAIAAAACVIGLLALLATVGLSRGDWRALGSALVRLAAAAMRPAVRLLVRKSPDSSAPPRRSAKRRARSKETDRETAGSARVERTSRPKPGRRAARERQGSLFDEGAAFKLPPLDLLTAGGGPDPAARVSREALEQNARLLESVLEDFGIKGEIVQVRPGPVVTLYELEPAPGTKSARVIGLADDIARSMSAVSARVAVVAGRNAIGIELPNSRRATVFLRDLLASREFESSRARLPLTLGKDISGAPVIADLSSMPHLLVAGTTGSGKSVGLNAMILSLLYRLPPEQCRLILVDPKMLELSIYDGIPHLLTPVVTEPKKAVVALKWAVREMEERYRAMSKIGVRSLEAYNKRVAEAQAKGEALKRRVHTGYDGETGEPVYEEQEFDFEPLPIVVVVIDEMADLMLVAGKDVEAVVQRLSQMARAAGIHLIMATQRPSVDVITGTIKANFPTRISFQVTAKVDSRTILGEQGAEQLLGQGDMLYMAGGGRISRVHGAFVTETEVEKVVAHLKRQGAPSYVESVTEEPEDGFDSPFIPGPSQDEDEDASLYDKAVDVVLRDRRVSTSYIQRRLRIGYNRAASLIEQMEDEGVISPPNHAGKREVLAPAREE